MSRGGVRYGRGGSAPSTAQTEQYNADQRLTDQVKSLFYPPDKSQIAKVFGEVNGTDNHPHRARMNALEAASKMGANAVIFDDNAPLGTVRGTAVLISEGSSATSDRS